MTVAVKKMLLTPKREPLFINEISVQKVTEHPNVVRLFDAYQVSDYIWVSHVIRSFDENHRDSNKKIIE